METAKLKKFAQYARRYLMEQVSTRLRLVLDEDSTARRESSEAVRRLEQEIASRGEEQVIERVAYTWFNRFCALRFMDVNRYTRIGVVSPAEAQFQPEILAEAKMGHIDEQTVPERTRRRVFDLLEGKAIARDPQGEAYRLLVVAACNAWNKAMPFLFQRIDDYTELLMPDDLLSGNSILARTREAMTPNGCRDVEVIGWLYQFYISEKKDQVFDGLRKNRKITSGNIPAATQLFTPHWIVRYLVENSLGRLWMLNRPDSRLAEQMDYYIKPDQVETSYIRIAKPEEIKICDPACGSGHILTYAFDLLYAIYEEEGYEPAEIPKKILTQNLFGIEIDERAGELAAFALAMKARARQRRFLNYGFNPNICVLENICFDVDELKDYMNFVGRDLFTTPLQTTLRQFEEADNFGSLIRPEVVNVDDILGILESKNLSGQLLLQAPHNKALQALRQADFLSPKYHVVITNPPYMNSKGMNGRLATWVKDNFPDSKSDLFATFIERNLDLAQKRGMIAMITMQSWMFLSSFERLRVRLLGQNTLLSMAHLGARAFDSIGGEVVMTTAFVLENTNKPEYQGTYLRLVDGRSESEKQFALRQGAKNPDCGWFYRASAADFKKIAGSPIAYWVSEALRNTFPNSSGLGEVCDFRIGMATGKNDWYVRYWHEVSLNRVGIGCKTREQSAATGKKWFPYAKGGDFRKWSGNEETLVNWEADGFVLQTTKYPTQERIWAHNFNLKYIFKPAICWTVVTTGKASFRYHKDGFLFDAAAGLCQPTKSMTLNYLVGLLNSKVTDELLPLLNPTINLHPGYLSSLPSKPVDKLSQVNGLIDLAKYDWDSFETSWDFINLPMLNPDHRQPTMKTTYRSFRAKWREMALEMQRLEEENNRNFINAYGLHDEVTPEVPLNEITLTCNPHYRYGGDKTGEEQEALLLADTMRELISYAVGCMFGRYALEKPGLVLANQGETIEDYREQVPESAFPADDDNVIPMLAGNWFTDDIVERFHKFLRVTFGEEDHEENLRFVEKALNVKNKRNYSIRDYFLGEFYNDHVKRYKKRPIYWLFSSPKGSFNALIYLHRYRPDTVSVVLNDYLREFRAKLASHKTHLEAVGISASATQGEKTKALKEIDKINKMITEMEEYEHEALYPLATEQVEIDLDDGVKVNYPKFGPALKKIPGL